MDQLKLSKIQIALYFDKNSEIEDNDFFKERMIKLGFEKNNSTKFSINNLPENTQYIICQKLNLVLQISQNRLDIINQNLENEKKSYEDYIKESLSQIEIIYQVFDHQKININRLGFVFSYLSLIEDDSEFKKIIEEIQNKFLVVNKRKKNIQIFNLAIQEKKDDFLENTDIQCTQAEMTTNNENGLVEKKPVKFVGIAKDFVFKEGKIYEKNMIINNFKEVSELCTQEKINEILQ